MPDFLTKKLCEKSIKQLKCTRYTYCTVNTGFPRKKDDLDSTRTQTILYFPLFQGFYVAYTSSIHAGVQLLYLVPDGNPGFKITIPFLSAIGLFKDISDGGKLHVSTQFELIKLHELFHVIKVAPFD